MPRYNASLWALIAGPFILLAILVLIAGRIAWIRHDRAHRRCRRCGSVDLHYSRPRAPMGPLYAAFGVIAYRCRACRHRFYGSAATN